MHVGVDVPLVPQIISINLLSRRCASFPIIFLILVVHGYHLWQQYFLILPNDHIQTFGQFLANVANLDALQTIPKSWKTQKLDMC